MSDTFLCTHRRVLWALVSCFLAFLVWALVAKIDIVLVAEGKLVPAGFVQSIQSPEDGVVSAVLVKDGDHVQLGQPLIELDSGYTQEDSAAADAEVRSLENKLARIDAELGGRDLQVRDAQVLSEFVSRKALQAARLEEARRQLEHTRSELAAAKERLRKYQELSPVATRQAAMLEVLKKEGFVSEAAHNEKLLSAIDSARERDVQVRAVESAAAQVRAAESAADKVAADYRQQLSIERTEVTLRLSQAQAALNKQAHKAGLQVLKAPVAGQVTGLSVRTGAQVVRAGEVLASLVPDGQPLRFEGWLRNEDSAFAHPGMPVKVKLAAYPFQKYGLLAGQLTWLGVNAETPEAMRNAQGEPLFYKVRVALAAQALTLDGQPLALKAGMQATGDLQAGTRTLFEYLTSPMRRVAMEAAREK